MDLKHYFLVALKSIVLLFALFFSFYLWAMGAVARFLGENHRVVTGTDPIGAKQVVSFATGIMISFTSKGRELIARYIRKFHPKVWRKFKNHYARRTKGLFRPVGGRSRKANCKNREDKVTPTIRLVGCIQFVFLVDDFYLFPFPLLCP